MATTLEKGNAFEKKIAQCYRKLGYEVVRNVPLHGQEVDLVATLVTPGAPDYILWIECKFKSKGNANNDDVNSIVQGFHAARSSGRAHECVVVTTNGFTQSAKTAAESAGIQLKTEQELVDRSKNLVEKMVPSLKEFYQQKSLSKGFVCGNGIHQRSLAPIRNIHDYLYDSCIAGQYSPTILLGDTGTGKSTLALKFCSRLLERHISHGVVPIPIYIPLERYKYHRDGRYLDHFIVDYLQKEFPVSEITWTSLKTCFAEGLAMLILDGFDEIQSLDSKQAIADELRHLFGTVSSHKYLMLTCRTTLLLDDEFQEIVSSQNFDGLPIEKIELTEFTTAQILEFARESGAEEIFKKVKQFKAGSIATRPLFLDLIVRMQLQKIPKSESELLDFAVSNMLQYRQNLRQSKFSNNQLRIALEECALEMWLSDKREFLIHELDTFLSRLPIDIDADSFTALAFDARVRTLFDASSSGIRFGHAGYRDFLCAYAIARRLYNPTADAASFHNHVISKDMCAHIEYAKKSEDEKLLVSHLQTYGKTDIPPKDFSSKNPLRWIPPGLAIVRDRECPGGSKIAHFEYGFWISKTPITAGDCRELGVKSCGHRDIESMDENEPITLITFQEAHEFCEKLGGRLPTEVEFQKSASWVDGTSPKKDQLFGSNKLQIERPLLVGTARPNEWGLQDMAGLVWQWTSTIDTRSRVNVCKGSHSRSRLPLRLDTGIKLIPTQSYHETTGFRIVFDSRNPS